MDRLDDQIDEQRVQFWRAQDVLGVTAGEDDDLIHDGSQDGLPSNVDMRSRTDVAWLQNASGVWVPTSIKRDDDILLAGIPMRVVGPARSRDFLAIYNDSLFGDQVYYFSASYVTDRAPADPDETPLPIIPA